MENKLVNSEKNVRNVKVLILNIWAIAMSLALGNL
jgi:hypothetical protein